jgi:Leucine-rich repeat (LRR) protein
MKKYPYKFLDAYERNDKDIFKGRNEEIETLYKMIFEADILLVYGASGTGKTSLIQCGLANKFKTYDWLALNIRRGQNINSSLDRALCAESDGAFVYEKQGEPHDIQDLDKKLETIYLNSFRPIYLIFDQFEELYILGNTEEQNQFIQHVKAILELEQPVKMIFSIREEYLGHLYDFERIVPQLLQKKLRVEPMNITKVQEVIAGTTTLASSNISIKNEEIAAFTEGIFKILQGKDATGKNKKALTIQLPYLQVLLDKIYLNQTDDKTHQTEAIFTTNDLAKTGQIDDVLRDFLEEQVILISRKLQANYPTIKTETIWQILSPFVTFDGTKEPISTTEIHKKTQTLLSINSMTFTQDFIEAFIKSKIIRYIEQDDTYEIAHDALAAKIADKRSDEEIALLEVKRLIKSQTAIYQTTQEFYTEKQLNFIESYLVHLDLDKTELDLITESKEEITTQKEAERLKQAAELKAAKAQAAKEKGLRSRAVYVAVAAMIIAVVAGYFYFEVEKANTLAENNLELAESNLFRAAVIAQHSDEKPLFEKKWSGYDFTKIIYDSINILSFRGWNISTIPVEVTLCHKLISLDIGENKISDIKSLESLIELEKLYLDKNPIKDFSSVKSLKNLTELFFTGNEIVDTDFFISLKELNTLKLIDVTISNLDFLEKLPNLRNLSLRTLGNSTDTSSIKNLKNLDILDLNGYQILDYNFLNNSKQLKSLSFRDMKVSFKKLKNLTQLEKLYLDNTQIHDLTDFQELPNLRKLTIMNNEAIDIKPLKELPNLKILSLIKTEILDSTSFEHLMNLEELYLFGNYFINLKYLKPNVILKGLFIPDKFSPKLSTSNKRVFLPIGFRLKAYHMTIYSPNRELLWESNKLVDGQVMEYWDGFYKGVLLSKGVYEWQVTASFDGDNPWLKEPYNLFTRIGTVQLLR